MELTPTAVVAGGEALARAPDGRVALVEGALPGERVQVEIVRDRPDHLRARVVSVEEASPDRVEPPCAHHRAGCGGCPWQHVAASAQPALKRAIVIDALRRIARLDDAPVGETVALPVDGYRTTMRVLVSGGRPALRRRHSHDPVRVDTCLVAHPLLMDVLHNGHFGGAREVTVRVGARTGERLVLADPSRARVTVPDDVAQGPGACVHEDVLGVRFRISARSFFQARPDGAETLARLVRAAVGPRRRVADLYAGVGLFSATLTDPEAVVAVEGARGSARDARHNLAGRPAHVVHAPVEGWTPRSDVDVVVADPPRTGLRAAGADVVAACGAARVVLVSCDPAALARDVRLLVDRGFALRSVRPVDQFGHTAHVEAVTVLDAR